MPYGEGGAFPQKAYVADELSQLMRCLEFSLLPLLLCLCSVLTVLPLHPKKGLQS
jgi:hypothetical protein